MSNGIFSCEDHPVVTRFDARRQLGATTVAYVAVGFCLAASFLNAAFDFCLGCEMYLLGKRTFSRA